MQGNIETKYGTVRLKHVALFHEVRKSARVPGKPPDQWATSSDGKPVEEQMAEWFARNRVSVICSRIGTSLEKLCFEDPSSRALGISCYLVYVAS